MFLAFLVLALLAAAALAVWILGKDEAVHAISDETPAWFVAIRYRPDATQQTVRRTLELGAGWNTTNLGLAAFVHDARTGEVLQAISLPVCVATGK